MCKLLVAVKLNDEPCEEYQRVLEVQLADFATQKDGVAVLTMDQQDQISVTRGLGDYRAAFTEFRRNIQTSRVIGLHTRIGTRGSTSIPNTHFFEHKDAFFAHNGFVSEYAGFGKTPAWSGYRGNKEPKVETLSFKELDGEQEVDEARVKQSYDAVTKRIELCNVCYDCDRPCQLHANDSVMLLALDELLEKGSYGKVKLKTAALVPVPEKTEFHQETKKEKKKHAWFDDRTDSEQFFASLPRPFTTEGIAKHIDDKGLTGVATIVDARTKKIWLMATRDIKVQTDFKNYAIFYSFKPEENLPNYRDVLGLPIQVGDDVEIPSYDLEEGVYEVSYDFASAFQRYPLIERKGGIDI